MFQKISALVCAVKCGATALELILNRTEHIWAHTGIHRSRQCVQPSRKLQYSNSHLGWDSLVFYSWLSFDGLRGAMSVGTGTASLLPSGVIRTGSKLQGLQIYISVPHTHLLSGRCTGLRLPGRVWDCGLLTGLHSQVSFQ